jgi:photosystem II stability/assembly factor-like uncharacterized protein
MNTLSSDILYPLLPAIYRERDVDREELKKFLAVIEQELQILEADIEKLYDNWFIETCDDWVVPYIGDLLGIRGVSPRSTIASSDSSVPYGQQESRAYVANTLAYRRRKGTATVLEQLVRDVTGWRARAVEFCDRLAITQHSNQVWENRTTVDLRNSNQLEQLGTPFEQRVAYTVQVNQGQINPLGRLQAKYNVSTLGLFLWRLQPYLIERSTARLLTQDVVLPGRCYTFSSLKNQTIPLFNPPQPEIEITQLAEEINVPGRLRCDPDYPGYQGDNPAFQIFINGRSEPIPPQEVLIAPFEEIFPSQDTTPDYGSPQPTKTVAVDPTSGRLAFLDRTPPNQVDVTYAYGFSADVGGGTYDRSDSIAAIGSADIELLTALGLAVNGTSSEPDQKLEPFPSLYWEIEQARSPSANPLASAVQTWNGTIQSWQGCRDLTCIPLARIEIPRVNVTQADARNRRRFQPGIVRGLTVIASLGTNQIAIAPGIAVDGQGRPIHLNQHEVIQLSQVKPRLPAQQLVWILLAYRANQSDTDYRLHVISQSQINSDPEQYSEATYIRLTGLILDIEGNIQKVIDPRNLPFQPGILQPTDIAQELTVITPPDQLTAIVTPGLAIDRLGRAMLVDRKIPLDLQSYQGQTIVLAIAYSDVPTGGNWQIHLLSETDAQNESLYPSDTFLRIATLVVPKVQITLSSESDRVLFDYQLIFRPNFEAGIVQGLTVISESGNQSVTVTAGRAIDSTGQIIEVTESCRIGNLNRYRNKTVILAIAHRQEPFVPNWEIKLLPTETVAADSTSSTPYLQLAELRINSRGQLATPPIDIHRSFKAGVIEGLAVQTGGGAKIQVAPGKAVDSKGQIISLEASYILDFSRYPGRNLVLFINNQPKQGWKPLDVEPADSNQSDSQKSWQYLGTVPMEPADNSTQTAESNGTFVPQRTGVILVKDNHSYEGNLDVVILANKGFTTQLYIIAANGHRPHIQGNLSVQGWAKDTDRFEPGCFILDGFLVEGKFTVHSGNLKQLKIAHCTLVPQLDGGLEVNSIMAVPQPETSEPTTDENSEADCCDLEWLIIAVIYCVALFGQLIQIAFGKNDLSPQQRIQQLVQFIWQELQRLWCAFTKMIYECLYPETEDSDAPPKDECCFGGDDQTSTSILDSENDDLDIELDHCLCGKVQLAEAIPTLTICNSVIDAVTHQTDSSENGQRGIAIAAIGTTLEIRTTTVLGTTQARRLEASNSIFTDVVSVVDRQRGCMRFCYVPMGSQTPLRYRCQPDLALQELPNLPPAITAFAIAPHSHHIFAGTAGNGLYRSLDRTEWTQIGPLNNPPHWVNQYITALIAFPQVDSNTSLYAGTVNGDLFYSVQNGDIWTALETHTTRIEPACLSAYAKVGTGTIASQGTIVQGHKTAFTTELNIGDAITALNQSQFVAHIYSDTSLTVSQAWDSDLPNATPFTLTNFGTAQTEITAIATHFQKLPGTVQVSSPDDQTTLVGSGTDFKTDLKPGDAITVYGQTGAETRIVTHIESKTTLTINQPFTSLPPEAYLTLNNLFAGTKGSGVFRFIEFGKYWTPMNQGLPHRHISSIVLDAQGRVVVATEGGVFRWSAQRNRWQSADQALERLDITALAITPDGRLFAGTQSGLVFRSRSQNKSWISVSHGLPQTKITALAVQTITGTVSVNGLCVRGSALKNLREGSKLTLQGQTRVLQKQAVCSDSSEPTPAFWLNAELCPEPSDDVSFTSYILFAGTAGAGLFRSHDQGKTWASIQSSFANRWITALAIDSEQGIVLAGTAIGSILCSSARGDSWIPINQGLPRADPAIAVLARMQPRFTSLAYGQPGYAQLSQTCVQEIGKGAEDGAEMGVFNHLKQPQREENLQAVLKDYLRFGLKAGIFYMT